MLKNFKDKNLIYLVLFSFFVKLLFSFLPSFTIDMQTWVAWGERLGSVGFAHFYTPDLWTEYTPGFLYWLWLGGVTHLISEPFVKVPTILADITVGVLLYSLIKKSWSKTAALWAFALYTLNPAVIFNGSVWGQVDGIFTLFLLLSLYFLVERKKIFLSSLAWVVAFLIKPQALGLIPVLFWVLYKNYGLAKTLGFVLMSLSLSIILSIPFFPHNPLGLFYLVQSMSTDYSYTSLFAYNLWGIVGMWRSDAQEFLRISLSTWGIIFYLLGLGISFLKIRKVKESYGAYLFAAFCFFCFFLFPTRVHERYLFPVLPFLLLSGFLLKNKTIIFLFIILSLLHFLNLYYPYSYYTPESFLSIPLIKDALSSMSSLISLATIAVFILFLFYKKFPKDLPFLDNFLLSSVKKESGEIAEFKNTKPILLAILGFALFSRLLFLWNPPAFYFDEVYHAFTAQEIVRGNPAAWEYSATPPKGFAYEWTHPPLAKLFMAGGILSLGDNSFAWRFPGVLFGVGCVYLVFLLAKIVFKDEKVGLISAFLFSLDGMALVMSRIGMNDIYFLFFGLLTIILFLKDRYLFSALALGLAFSSKWTASFILITLFIAWLLYKRKFEWRIAFYFLMPPILYLASYTIFFTTGHDLIDFWHTQQQMWWYHTQLVATHPYSSPWWSWPLMLKPIWLYTSSQNGLEQNIYIAGNPAIFVGGFFAVLVSLYWSYKRKDKATLFVALCYLAMFLPWARSPRIMFLYHYLPAVPFMIILLAWILKRFWDYKQKNLVKGYFIIVILLFILYYPFWTGIGIPQWWNALRF